MKQRLNLLLLCACGIFMISCSNKDKPPAVNQDTILAFDETINKGVIEMDQFHINDSTTYKGHVYIYDITRMPDSTLATVTEQETQNLYRDNHVELKILKDGASFVEKTFTKKDFLSYIDEGFKKNGILEGFVFNENSDNGLCFSTSVSYPQSDMYITLSVTIAPNGTISIVRDNIIEEDEEETE